MEIQYQTELSVGYIGCFMSTMTMTDRDLSSLRDTQAQLELVSYSLVTEAERRVVRVGVLGNLIKIQ